MTKYLVYPINSSWTGIYKRVKDRIGEAQASPQRGINRNKRLIVLLDSTVCLPYTLHLHLHSENTYKDFTVGDVNLEASYLEFCDEASFWSVSSVGCDLVFFNDDDNI